jgi:3-oxoacyl-[acyl-carrier-protein] synthase III
MMNARIIGTGSFAPQRVLTNEQLQEIVNTSDEWIVRRTGIRQRRISSPELEENTAQMATQAARAALEMAGVAPEQLDTIIVGTVTSDRLFPSTACLVQKEIGAANAAAWDVSAGCSGFLYALSTAQNAIRCGASQNALIIGAERLSSVTNWQDRGTCVLLGDGAGAVVLQAASDSDGILSTHIGSDGSVWDLLYCEAGNDYIPAALEPLQLKPFHLKMTGNRLFKHAVSCMASISLTALKHNDLTTKDIAVVIPHQANIRIVNATAEHLGIPIEKFFVNLDQFGNTSSASIPIALDQAHRTGRIKNGDIVLLVSFGAGLTWGAALVGGIEKACRPPKRPFLKQGVNQSSYRLIMIKLHLIVSAGHAIDSFILIFRQRYVDL